MKTIYAAITLLCMSCSAQAALKVTNAWVKPTAPGQSVAAAYMTLTTSEDVKVIGASSSIARSVEIHEMNMSGNVMKMRQLEELALKAGKSEMLAPGGYHLMLQDIKHQIKAGEVVPMVLVIQDKIGNQYKISFSVDAKKSTAKDVDKGMHHH
ncbi:MAG: copper chaperone PCu(A)C [Methylotenera sp.]|nr:copper chaperone PCu(A)C [Methylotenera sp.]